MTFFKRENKCIFNDHICAPNYKTMKVNYDYDTSRSNENNL